MSQDQNRILVVDDERGIREGCQRILSAAGYSVDTAEDGKQGFDVFKRKGGFDAVLVDLKMPRMQGTELTKLIHGADEDAVILVITAYAAIDTAVEATKSGAYGYIPKPFTPNELLLPIRNGLEHRRLALEAKKLREDRERNLMEVTWERTKCSRIIQCMKDAVLVVNRHDQVVLCNDSAGRILPMGTVRQIPFPVESLELPALKNMLRQALKAKKLPTVLSKEITLGEGTYMANVSPVSVEASETAGIVAVLTDITALKRLEIAKSMFVTMVAHEVKSPLAAAEGYLQILLEDYQGVDEAKKKQMLERTLVRINALRSMVSELMNITAIETGNFTIQRAPCSMAGILKKALEAVNDDAAAKRIEISFAEREHPELKRVFVDEEAAVIIFKNILENAVKYTPDGGRVSVDVDQNGVFAEVKIRDSGIGIEPSECGKIFSEFYRAKSDYTANIPGTGLGLTLVKKLLDLQNGKISLASEPKKGSEFTVYLPFTR